MAKKKFTANLEIIAEKNYSCSLTKDYSDSFVLEQELDNTAAFITLSEFQNALGSASSDLQTVLYGS